VKNGVLFSIKIGLVEEDLHVLTKRIRKSSLAPRQTFCFYLFYYKRQILYLADFINIHRPFVLAQTPYVFYTLL